jgi:carbonic anhydrase
VEQCINLYKTGVVQRKRLATFNDPNAEYAYPRIHGLVFDPKEGRLRPLPIDVTMQKVKRYQHIYNLYDAPKPDNTILG